MAYQVTIDKDTRLITIDKKTYTLEELQARTDRTNVEQEILWCAKEIFNSNNKKPFRNVPTYTEMPKM